MEQVVERKSKVSSLIASKKMVEAMQLCLEDPPVQSKSEQVKQANANVVFECMQSCSKGDMKKSIDSLDVQQQDVLMKYIYLGLSIPQNNATLLEWHAVLLKVSGVASIIRALTDRKTV